MMKSWKGQTVLVTGASGGIGAEIARLLASRGADLVLVARSAPKLAEIKKSFEREYGILVRTIEKDLSRDGAAGEVYLEARQAARRIDALVNNAGAGVWGPFVDTDLALELDLLRLNITALTHLTKLFVRDMVREGRGKILNVSSTAAFQPGPLMAVYYASKAYVQSFSEALSEELRGTGVTVTVLCPGPTRTGFGDSSGMGKTHLFAGPLVQSSEAVARAGVEAMEKGRAVRLTGAVNRIVAFSVRLLPRAFVRRFVHRMQRRRRKT